MGRKRFTDLSSPVPVRCSAGEVAAIQRQQPFPMPLGGVAIVNRPLREREAVMGAGIDLDLGIGAIVFHSLFHLLDDIRRRVDIGLGAAEIKFSFGLSGGQMGTVGLVGGQMCTVN